MAGFLVFGRLGRGEVERRVFLARGSCWSGMKTNRV